MRGVAPAPQQDSVLHLQEAQPLDSGAGHVRVRQFFSTGFGFVTSLLRMLVTGTNKNSFAIFVREGAVCPLVSLDYARDERLPSWLDNGQGSKRTPRSGVRIKLPWVLGPKALVGFGAKPHPISPVRGST